MLSFHWILYLCAFVLSVVNLRVSVGLVLFVSIFYSGYFSKFLFLVVFVSHFWGPRKGHLFWSRAIRIFGDPVKDICFGAGPNYLCCYFQNINQFCIYSMFVSFVYCICIRFHYIFMNIRYSFFGLCFLCQLGILETPLPRPPHKLLWLSGMFEMLRYGLVLSCVDTYCLFRLICFVFMWFVGIALEFWLRCILDV